GRVQDPVTQVRDHEVIAVGNRAQHPDARHLSRSVRRDPVVAFEALARMALLDLVGRRPIRRVDDDHVSIETAAGAARRAPRIWKDRAAGQADRREGQERAAERAVHGVGDGRYLAMISATRSSGSAGAKFPPCPVMSSPMHSAFKIASSVASITASYSGPMA